MAVGRRGWSHVRLNFCPRFQVTGEGCVFDLPCAFCRYGTISLRSERTMRYGDSGNYRESCCDRCWCRFASGAGVVGVGKGSSTDSLR